MATFNIGHQYRFFARCGNQHRDGRYLVHDVRSCKHGILFRHHAWIAIPDRVAYGIEPGRVFAFVAEVIRYCRADGKVQKGLDKVQVLYADHCECIDVPNDLLPEPRVYVGSTEESG